MCSIDSPVEKEGAVGCLLPLNELQRLLRRRTTVIPIRDHPAPWPGAHPALSSLPETTPIPSPEPTQPRHPVQDHPSWAQSPCSTGGRHLQIDLGEVGFSSLQVNWKFFIKSENGTDPDRDQPSVQGSPIPDLLEEVRAWKVPNPGRSQILGYQVRAGLRLHPCLADRQDWERKGWVPGVVEGAGPLSGVQGGGAG